MEKNFILNDSQEFKTLLNMSYIIDRIEKSEKKIQVGDGKDILLILGTTGSRDRLATSILLGQSGIVEKLNNEDSDQRSSNIEVTSQIMKEDSLYFQTYKIKENNSVLYDFSGLFENKLEEENIVNTICFKQLISCCKSIRPIVFIKYSDLGTDGEGLIKKLLILLQNVIVSQSFQSCIFLYTDVPEGKSIQDIENEYKRNYHNQKEDNNQQNGYQKLLSTLLNQIHQYKEKLIISHQNESNEQYLKIIFEVNPFENPSSQLKIEFSKKTCRCIEQYSKKISDLIQEWKEEGKYEDICQLLKTLQLFFQQMDYKPLDQQQKDILKFTFETQQERIDKIVTEIRKSAEENSMLLISTEKKFEQTFQEIKIVNNHTLILPKDLQQRKENFIENIKEISRKILKSVIQNFEQKPQLTKDGLLKLKLISGFIVGIEELYESSKTILFQFYKNKIDNLTQETKDLPRLKKINDLQINPFVLKLENVESIEKLIGIFYQEDVNKLDEFKKIIQSLREHYEQTLDRFKQNIVDIKSTLVKYLQEEPKNKTSENRSKKKEKQSKSYLTNELSDRIVEEEVNYLIQIEKNQRLSSLLEGANKSQDRAINLLQQFSVFLIDIVKNSYQSRQQLKKLEICVQLISKINTLDREVFQLIESEYNTFRNYLDNKLKNKKQKIKSILKQIQKERQEDLSVEEYQLQIKRPLQKQNLSKLSKMMKFISDMSWTDEFLKNDLAKKTVKKISKELNLYLSYCIDKSKELEKNNKFNLLYQFPSNLKNLEIMESEMKSYKSEKEVCYVEIQALIDCVISGTKKFFKQIKNVLDKSNLTENEDLLQLNNKLLELKQITELKLIPKTSKLSKLQKKIKEQLALYFQSNSENIYSITNIQQLSKVNQNNNLMQQGYFIQNMAFILTECHEVISYFGGNQKILHLKVRLNQIYEDLISEYNEEKLKQEDLQKIVLQHQVIKAFINRFRSMISTNINLLQNPRELITIAYKEIHAYISEENFQLGKVLKCIINIQNPQDQLQLKDIFSTLSQKSEYHFQVLSTLLFMVSVIDIEYILKIKNSLQKIDNIHQVFKDHNQVKEDEKIKVNIINLQDLLKDFIELKAEKISQFATQIDFQRMEDHQNTLFSFLKEIEVFQWLCVNSKNSNIEIIKSVGATLCKLLDTQNIQSPAKFIKLYDQLFVFTNKKDSPFKEYYLDISEKLILSINNYFDKTLTTIEKNSNPDKNQINPTLPIKKIKGYLEDLSERGIPFNTGFYQRVYKLQLSLEDTGNRIVRDILHKFNTFNDNNEIIADLCKELEELQTTNLSIFQIIFQKLKEEFNVIKNNLTHKFTEISCVDIKKQLLKSRKISECFSEQYQDQFKELIFVLVQTTDNFVDEIQLKLNQDETKFGEEQQLFGLITHLESQWVLKNQEEYKENIQITQLWQKIGQLDQCLCQQLSDLIEKQQKTLKNEEYVFIKDIKLLCYKFESLIKLLINGHFQILEDKLSFPSLRLKINSFEKFTTLLHQNLILNDNEIQNDFKEGRYKEIKDKIQKTKYRKEQLKKYYSIDLIDISSIIKLLLNRINNITVLAEQKIEKDLFDSSLNELVSKIYDAEDTLKDIEEFSDKNVSQIKIIEQKINNKIDEIYAKSKFYINTQYIEGLAEQLSNIQMIGINIVYFSKIVQNKIEQFLSKVKQQKDYNFIFSLGYLLQNQVNGAIIVDQQPIFTELKTIQFNKTVGKHNLDYILNKFQYSRGISSKKNFNENQKKYLTQLYAEYHQVYLRLINQNVLKKDGWKDIIQKTKNIILKDNSFSKLRKQIPVILAHICAYWTLQKSIQQERISENDSMKKPHNVQIISIFLLLGIEKQDSVFDNIKEMFPTKTLENRLIQIKTGEGKSLTLGFCSIILALFNYEVDVACYSSYLSSRDYSDFKDIFKDFEVDNKIFYGTMGTLSEKIINRNGDIRELTRNIIFEQPKNLKQELPKSNKSKILLIDEVDVLFSSDFYGQTFNIVFTFSEKEIVNIIKLIWEKRNQPEKDLNIFIKQSSDYLEFIKKFPKLQVYFDHQIEKLIEDCKSVEEHETMFKYCISNNIIGYQQLDSSFSYTTIKRYKTLFLYFYKHEQKEISESGLNEQIKLTFGCGRFSYVHLIENFYQSIFGLTGTLEQLNKVMKEALKRYNFKMDIYAPSMFGTSNLDFKQVDMVNVNDDKQNQYLNIQKIANEAKEKKQSVLIFFKDDAEIDDYLQNKKEGYIIFKAGLNQIQIQPMVTKSTISKNVSICIREFGRGTDFVCLDPEVEANGGVVVIQTFLSKDKSEEIQIMGRTARQDKKGKYYLVLNQEQLNNDLNINSQQIQQWKNNQSNTSLYQNLNIVRDKKQDEDTTQIEKSLNEAKTLHDKTIEFCDHLFKNNLEKVIEFVQND